jgi:hypothetical protein
VASSDCAEDIQYEMYAKRAGFTINSYRIGETPGRFDSISGFANYVCATMIVSST